MEVSLRGRSVEGVRVREVLVGILTFSVVLGLLGCGPGGGVLWCLLRPLRGQPRLRRFSR